VRRPLAKDAAGALVEIGDRRPAEVAAARAVGLMGEIGTSLATAEALDQTCLHALYFGVERPPVYLGDPSFKGGGKAVIALVVRH